MTDAVGANGADGVGADGVDRVGATDARAALLAVVEAVLFVSDAPVEAQTLAAGLGRTVDDVTAALTELEARCAGGERGVRLRRLAGGWRFTTAEEVADEVERFLLEGQSARLTQAALETLALVAYLQPVTRSRVSAVRGVNADGALRTLVSRGLVEVTTLDPESGAHLHGTTALFLEKLGLDSLADLPPLAPLLPGHEDASVIAEEVADGTVGSTGAASGTGA